jgi:hypothetical protein
MAEVKKRRIVIASVLKPVNDTRMAEKIGWSLADTGRFEIHIIGFPGLATKHVSIHLHALPFFKRLSLKRLVIPWHIFRKVFSLKPDLLIITTHELLVMTIIFKLVARIRVIYDVQENYYRNILFTTAFPVLLRPVIALYVRLKEILLARFIDHFFLAEKAYAPELHFLANRYTVLENKSIRFIQSNPQRTKNLLLFSGTMAESTGVFKAIELTIKLHALNPSIQLILAGYCSQPSVLSEIKDAISSYSYIRLVGGDHLVPHEQILQYIQQAEAGIIAYPYNPSTFHSIPTKLYEYLGLKLPILLIHHSIWEALCRPYPAAIVFDPQKIDPQKILSDLHAMSFYTLEPTDVYWDTEQPKLIRQVYQLLH